MKIVAQSQSPEQNEYGFPAFVGRHFVCIAFYDEALPDTREKSSDPGFFTITATLLSVREYWLLVTAKHCFDQIDERLEKGRRRIVRCEILDYLGDGASFFHAIPFDYQNAGKIKFGDDDDFDVGAIVVRHDTRVLLERNGIVPFSEKTWKGVPAEFEYYAACGIPFGVVDKKGRQPNHPTFSPTVQILLAPLKKLNRRPRFMTKRKTPRFYGRLSKKRIDQDGVRFVLDMHGMSGGPILGFKRDASGQLRYWIIAFQSDWLCKKNVISGCLATHVGYSIEWPLIESARIRGEIIS